MVYAGQGGQVDLTVTDRAQVTQNTAGASGALLDSEGAADVSVLIGPDVITTNNQAPSGAVMSLKDVASANTLQLLGSFTVNTALTMGGVLALTNSSLGGVQLGSDSRCQVSSNAAGDGGVLALVGSTISNLTVHSACALGNNSATGSGGFAALMSGSNIGGAVMGGRYSGHTAGLNGGLVSLSEASNMGQLFMPTGMSATRSSAAAQAGVLYVGAACRLDKLRLEGAELTSNTASTSGGIVSVPAGGRLEAVEIKGSVLESNTARTGGCMALDGAISTINIAVRGCLRFLVCTNWPWHFSGLAAVCGHGYFLCACVAHASVLESLCSCFHAPVPEPTGCSPKQKQGHPGRWRLPRHQFKYHNC